jgi:MoaA/NifB/PqqE/SkfB family radical SAM enzyme
MATEAAPFSRDIDRPSRRIEADWYLELYCQFRCEYCFSRRNQFGVDATLITPTMWRSAFRRTGLRWHLHLTGGEPLLHPRALEILELLGQDHELSLNTNLPEHRARELCHVVSPRVLRYIHVGVHPRQRQRHGGAVGLWTSVEALRSAGFKVFLSCVMFPEYFEGLCVACDEYRVAHGLILIPKAFRGTWHGSEYPASYTPTQRDRFSELSAIAADYYHPILKPDDADCPTVNPLLDILFVRSGIPLTQGMPCNAGVDFVRITPAGRVFRCGKSTFLGDLMDGSFRQLASAQECTDGYCPYFCRRHLATESERSLR